MINLQKKRQFSASHFTPVGTFVNLTRFWGVLISWSQLSSAGMLRNRMKLSQTAACIIDIFGAQQPSP
ncbi:hypothetical protein O6P43_028219 [Quillaja saponaria]|uniref:Uncharacterized protein n=1 Tax=Quillaja saponaria TaxID=32244 RepID=A0AAD7KXV6_QUISA|nr:hypothetical protein O6P43_028219 [Quillaja saponaria]